MTGSYFVVLVTKYLLKLAKTQYLSDLSEASKGNSKQFWLRFCHLSTKNAKSSLSSAFTADDINDYFFISTLQYHSVYFINTNVSTLLFTCMAVVIQISTVNSDDIIFILTSLDSAKGPKILVVMDFHAVKF